MQYLLWASLIYAGFAVLGILLWAGITSKKRLYLPRGLPPALLAQFPPTTMAQQHRAYLYGIPVLLFLFFAPLGYSIFARFILGEGFLSVWAGTFVLLLAYNLADLLIVDWLIICWITPHFFVVPGTEGHPGYKDYLFHLRGALKGMVFVIVGSVIFAGITEVLFFIFGRAVHLL